MAVLSSTRKQFVMNTVQIIEAHLVKKYKINNEGTFGSKLKLAQPHISSQFILDSFWTILKIRNLIVHSSENDKITTDEYKLFESAKEYLRKKEKIRFP